MTPKTLYFYLHTHWDREWYQPFESYRANLVDVVEQILGKLEDGALPCFMLDGQAKVLEDVLEIRPSLAPRLKEQIAAGRLSVGPWYVLADQMLVGGESLIRNLELGIKLSSQVGRCAMLGYCPDTFGHSADLPRILKGFGIDWAVVWRGVPELSHGPVFSWQSADGSEVRAYHLNQGYYQTPFFEGLDSMKLSEHLESFIKSGLLRAGDSEVALIPVGGDHIGTPPNFSHQLSCAIVELQERLSAKDIKGETVLLESLTETLSGLLDSSKSPATQEWNSELRENYCAQKYARAFLLPDVLSTRLYLKHANRQTEHLLFRVAEPLFTVLSVLGVLSYPAEELSYALKLLLDNHPHDSICGCSADAVHKEMMVRTDKFNALMDSLMRKVRFVLSSNQEAASLQGGAKLALTHPMATMTKGSLKHLKLIGLKTGKWHQSIKVQLGVAKEWLKESSEPIEVGSVLRDTSGSPWLQVTSVVANHETFIAAGLPPDFEDRYLLEGYIAPQEFDGISLKTIRTPLDANEGIKFEPWHEDSALAQNATTKSIANSSLQVSVDINGKLSVKESGQAGRTFELGHYFQDVGDGGDTYNFDPLVADKPLVSKFEKVEVEHRGPIYSSLTLTYSLEIPEQAIDENGKPADLERFVYKTPPTFSRSPKRVHTLIHTTISVTEGSQILNFKTTLENRSIDHRLEVVLTTGALVDRSYSENHFSLVERPSSKVSIERGDIKNLPVGEGDEAPTDRFPCQRFFIANDQVFLNSGLPEYGVHKDKVTYTILRSVTKLSRGRLRTRGGGAGPWIRAAEAACLGAVEVKYGWAPLTTAQEGAEAKSKPGCKNQEVYRIADEYEGTSFGAWMELESAEEQNGQNSAPETDLFTLLNIDNPAIHITSLRRMEDSEGLGSNHMVLRLLNSSTQKQTAELKTALKISKLTSVKLDLSEIEALNHEKGSPFSLHFRKNELKTLLIQVGKESVAL